jgi:hypothetical protein
MNIGYRKALANQTFEYQYQQNTSDRRTARNVLYAVYTMIRFEQKLKQRT